MKFKQRITDNRYNDSQYIKQFITEALFVLDTDINIKIIASVLDSHCEQITLDYTVEINTFNSEIVSELIELNINHFIKDFQQCMSEDDTFKSFITLIIKNQ